MSETKTILHVEDDPFEREAVQKIVEKHISGLNWLTESKADLARKFIENLEQPLDLLVLDLDLGHPKTSGIDLLKIYKGKFAHSPVVIRTHHDDIEHLKVIHQEKADGICIKVSDDKLLGKICSSLINEHADSPYFASWPEHIFPTPGLKNWCDRLPKILKSAISHIHVFGPSGSGKEVYADLLQLSLPSNTPFIRVNCASVSSGVFASEFYGHVKGSFTGASKDRPGYLKQADGGWLFLDEVQCLSLEAQASLLRAMESGEFIPVGSDKPIKLDVKVLSASNENIESLVEDGKFRLDLEQRLCEVKIELQGLHSIQTLNQRVELIHHIARYLKGGPYQVTPSCAMKLAELSWDRGHFRELRNTMRAMTEHQRDGILSSTAIPETLIARENESEHKASSDSFHNSVQLLMVESLKVITSEEPGISLRKIAEKLNISRTTLSRRIHQANEQGLISAELADRIPTSLQACQ